MAVIRDPANYEGYVANIASLAVICGLAAAVFMLKFKGFRASLNFSSSNKRSDFTVETNSVSIAGAYRANREEFFGNGSVSDPRKKITPSMVKLPATQNPTVELKSSKSTSDLDKPVDNRLPTNLKKSTPNVSTDPRGGAAHNQISNDINVTKSPKTLDKEQKLLEKEEKKQKKLAAQEQAREAKAKKEKEKSERKKKKHQAPLQPPQTVLPTQPVKPLPAQRTKPPDQKTPPNYSTNTLESSISRASGPPPYSDVPNKFEVVPNKRDDTGNTSFGRKIDGAESSWDLVSQHRQEVARPVAPERRPKRMVMDLQYNVGMPADTTRDNSDA